MGSFRPAAGNQHLHWYCNFAGPPIETVPKSLLHSCRSELTRQGISLSLLLYFRTGLDSIFIQQRSAGAWHIVSEDPCRLSAFSALARFLRIVQSQTIVTAHRRKTTLCE